MLIFLYFFLQYLTFAQFRVALFSEKKHPKQLKPFLNIQYLSLSLKNILYNRKLSRQTNISHQLIDYTITFVDLQH